MSPVALSSRFWKILGNSRNIGNAPRIPIFGIWGSPFRRNPRRFEEPCEISVFRRKRAEVPTGGFLRIYRQGFRKILVIWRATEYVPTGPIFGVWARVRWNSRLFGAFSEISVCGDKDGRSSGRLDPIRETIIIDKNPIMVKKKPIRAKKNPIRQRRIRLGKHNLIRCMNPIRVTGIRKESD